MGCRYGHAEGAAGCAIPVYTGPDVITPFGHDAASVSSADMPCAADLTSAFGHRGPDSAELVGQTQTMHAMTVGRMHGRHSGAPRLVP